MNKKDRQMIHAEKHLSLYFGKLYLYWIRAQEEIAMAELVLELLEEYHKEHS